MSQNKLIIHLHYKSFFPICTILTASSSLDWMQNIVTKTHFLLLYFIQSSIIDDIKCNQLVPKETFFICSVIFIKI